MVCSMSRKQPTIMKITNKSTTADMLMIILLVVAALSVMAILIFLWDYWKHGGAAIEDPHHPGRLISIKDAKKQSEEE